jgi:hypothetical protein
MAVAASSKGGLMLRVDPEQTQALLTEPHVGPFEMRGRPVDGWLRVGNEALDDEDAFQRWVGYGVGYARSLPPK